MTKRIAVTGAGGFIGHHLVRELKRRGHWVRGIDIKKPEFSTSDADEFWFADLRDKDVAIKVLRDIDEVYALASDVGGVGHLSRWNYEIINNNMQIDLHTLQGVAQSKGRKILYVSSACVYPVYLQNKEDLDPLKEEQVMPADPEGAYGWEKLIAERMLLHAAEDNGLDIRIVRFQNIYGPEEIFQGGREKVIGALCRKVAMAENNSEIEIWGDGNQKRSFTYVSDAVDALIEVMNSDYKRPLNISNDENISVNEVAEHLIRISGKEIRLKHIEGPVGVRGRFADNTLRKTLLKWSPQTNFSSGLAKTYVWVDEQIRKNALKK